MRHGLLGGTFDPIHVGHLDVAEAARGALDLETITLLPAPAPPHRGAPRASAAHRFAMAALAAQSVEYLRLSDVEFDSPGPSYTNTTLDRLAARGLDTTTLFFIIGADAFGDIASWMNFPAVLDRCHFVVISRPGLAASSMRDMLPALSHRMFDAPCTTPAEPCIFLVDAPTSPVSSTEIRERLSKGRSVAGLVPPAVEAYIEKHALYQPPTGAA
ncbi:MAG TPA: nicotinate-nucleotide adenylyltransferase [Vicinamibacterales bacterium]|nr:nicotinate-nucleotide adenylyltransferase [Vicinamibacterales bacterium]